MARVSASWCSTPVFRGVKQLFIAALLASGRGAHAALPASTGVCPARPFYERDSLEVGVEQEFNHLDVTRATDALRPVLGQVQSTQHSWMTWLGHADVEQKGAAQPYWRVVPDVTLSTANSFELISPVLSYDDTPQVGLATAQAVAHGATTDSMAALHIHVNHSSLTPAHVVNLLEAVHTQTPMLLRLSRTSPRQSDYYCRPLEPALLAALRDDPPASKAAIADLARDTARTRLPGFTYPADMARYYLVNLHYLRAGETLEYRQFDATTRPEQVQAFIDLSLALTSAARDSPLAYLIDTPLDPSDPDDVALFLDSIGLVGERLSGSRQVLRGNAQEIRGFEWAVGERWRLAQDLAIGAVGLALLAARPALPGWTVDCLTTSAIAAFARASAVGAEAHGLSSFEVTDAVRRWTGGRWMVAQAAYAAVMLGLGAWGVP